jgi:hypothetical protein
MQKKSLFIKIFVRAIFYPLAMCLLMLIPGQRYEHIPIFSIFIWFSCCWVLCWLYYGYRHRESISKELYIKFVCVFSLGYVLTSLLVSIATGAIGHYPAIQIWMALLFPFSFFYYL